MISLSRRLLFGCMILLSFISCELSDTSDELVHDNSTIILRTPVLPGVENGMLTFQDSAHFIAYYDWLDQMIQNSVDPDSVLAIEEARHAYNSLRSSTYVDELEDHEIQDYLNRDFIFDLVIKSILNEHYEVKIGNDAYVHFKIRTFRIDSANIETLNGLRTQNKLGVEPPILAYTSYLTTCTPENEIVYDPPVVLRSHGQFVVDFNSSSVFPCPNIDRAVTVDGAFLVNGDPSRIESWSVDYGDGTVVEETSPSTRINPDRHIYADYDAYTVVVTARYLDPHYGFVTNTETFQHRGVSGSCTNQELDERYWDEDPTKQWAMESKIWFKWARHSKFGGSTRAWKRVGSKWKSKKASDLYTHAEVKWRNTYLDGCTVQQFEQETHTCTTCKKEKAQMWSRSNGPDQIDHGFQPIEAATTHRLWHNGITIYRESTLWPCD